MNEFLLTESKINRAIESKGYRTEMSEVEEASIDIHPITFPPEILARISPDLSLQRHLSLGFRPSLRSFEEFRDVNVDCGTLSRYVNTTNEKETEDQSNVLGSAVLREGKVFVVTKITGGIIEDTTVSSEDMDEEEDAELLELTEDRSDINKYCSVYPVVEIERGRMGACTDEEMTISQRLYDSMLHSKILSKRSLKVRPGIRITQEDGKMEIIYPDSKNNDSDTDENNDSKNFSPNKKWSYVLYAKIEVFGRTGPVFDLCWNSLVYALKSVKLPRAFIDERATDLKMTVRTRGRNAIIRETYNILCDPDISVPLNLKEENIAFASTFGVIDLDPEANIADVENEDDEMEIDEPKSILLADIDTEAEEISIKSTINIINNPDGSFKHLSLTGGGSKITPEILKRSIMLSKKRSNDLYNKLPSNN